MVASQWSEWLDAGGWHYESVVAEVAAYVDSLIENKSVPIDPLNCAYAIKVVKKAYESIKQGNCITSVN